MQPLSIRSGYAVHRPGAIRSPLVLQKCSPCLGRWLGLPTRHQIGHCPFGNLDSQFEQLAMNTRSPPKRVGFRYLQNKFMYFSAYSRSAGSFSSGLTAPIQLETLSMPPNDRFGLDDDQCLLPTGPKTAKQDTEKTVSVANSRPFDGPLHGGHLLAKR